MGEREKGGATNADEDTTAHYAARFPRMSISLQQTCDAIDLDIDIVAESTLSLQPP